MPGLKQILVAVDFSPHAEHALEQAMELASSLGATVRLLHVVHANLGVGYPGFLVPGMEPDPMKPVLAAAEKHLRETAERVGRGGPAVEFEVREGSPAETICAVAEERSADLIVMGTRGRTGLAHVLLGSVAERTIRLAPCPVLTVNAATDGVA